MLTLEAAAEIVGCTPQTLKGLFVRGDLDAVRVGREWSIPRGAFLTSLNRYAVEQAAERRANRQPTPAPRPVDVVAAKVPQSRRRPLLILPEAVSQV